MKTSASQKISIGIFTIVGLLILIIGIFLIGKKKNMFGDTFVIHGTFNNVGGLQVGNNVRFVGINVGTVQSIEIISDTMARVDMRLQSNVKRFLKNNAVASISSDGLMGDKLIEIDAGPDSGGTEMRNGGKIITVNPMDMGKTMAKIGAIADNAESITNSLASIFGEVSHGKGSLGKLLYSNDLEKSLVGTAASADQTMHSIQKGSEGFSENMDALKHNFLLKGYYKKKAKRQIKKEKKEERKKNNNQ